VSEAERTPDDDIVALAAQLLERVAPEGTPLVAAVSGGADSVALAMALGRLAHRWPFLAVAFVDHGLRDVTAERAAAEEAARRAGVTFVARQVAVDAGTGNLQARARAERYRALLAVATELDRRALVATGHTRSDQAETVLSRLLRGSGIAGLSALAPRRGRVVRPLLEVSRAQTRTLGLAFQDDPGNATARFQRNRLRTLLEGLGAEQPALERALARLAESARASTRLLDALALAAPQTSMAGLEPEVAATFALHLLRARGARGPRHEALAALAAALTQGGVSSVSLGEGLRGIARHGRAEVTDEDDPRRTVVAWRPGTYRGPSLELEMTEQACDNAADSSDTIPDRAVDATGSGATGEFVAWAPAAEVAWPVRLRPARRGTPGVLGDEVDLETGERVGGWRLEDASGRTLVPSTDGAARPDGGPRSPGIRWIRIVLRPSARARDTMGCGRADRSATQLKASPAHTRRRDGRLG